MPNYGTLPLTGTGTGILATVLPQGDSYLLFNAETPTPPQSSIAIARSYGPSVRPLTFEIQFAAASPTDVVVIQGSNFDPNADATFETLFTSTNKQFDNYTDTANWAFYRAQLVSQSAGGALTVKVNG